MEVIQVHLYPHVAYVPSEGSDQPRYLPTLMVSHWVPSVDSDQHEHVRVLAIRLMVQRAPLLPEVKDSE